MIFEFTEDCRIGIEEIDKEHEYLFQLLNDAHVLATEYEYNDHYQELKDILAKLGDYADQHFAHEEAYMEQICDPELIVQRSQHAIFREQILKLDLRKVNEIEEQKKVLTDLLNFLAKWLYHHILGSDILIGKLPPLEKWMVKENSCEFTDEYRTGIELIDQEHEGLFQIIAQTEELVREFDAVTGYDHIMELLGKLKDYTIGHFADEEAYMESIHYEGLPAQKRAHEAFITKLSEIDLDEIDKAPEDQLHRLLEFLLGWLINHILLMDKQIPSK